MQKFINIAFAVPKYLKWLNQRSSPWNLTQSKSDENRVKGKNGRVQPINFCGWPSKIYRCT